MNEKRPCFLGGLVVLLFLISNPLIGQTVQLKGQITDRQGFPVAYANIVVQAQLDSTKNIAISSASGWYKIHLIAAQSYQLKIKALGFQVFKDTLSLQSSHQQNYQLRRVAQRLEEVVIEGQLPISVLEDKTIYKADAFRNGYERVLYDLLKKMPGLQVDREGNVKVNGKIIRNLTIAGRRFFTGDPKLGVLNIPADAVATVEVLKNHHQIGLLNTVSDRGSLSLNITLKEGHKKFAFGESKIGGGIDNRYLINPNIFYHSPETSVNFIGNFNNLGQDDASGIEAYNFESNFDQLIKNKSSFGRRISGVGDFLASDLNTYRKIIFGTANLNQKIAKYWRMNVNTFAKQAKMQTRQTLFNAYLGQGKTSELRRIGTEHKLFQTLNKIRLRYDNLDDKEILIDFIYNHAAGTGRDMTLSVSEAENHFFQRQRKPRQMTLINTISYNKRFDYRHLLAINSDVQYISDSRVRNWNLDTPVFSNLLPFQEQSTGYNLVNQKKTTTYQARFNTKLYWILNRKNHIYPELGMNFLTTDFETTAVQKLEGGEEFSFENAGFGNRLQFELFDVYSGLTYKMMFGNLLIHAGAFAHTYLWNATQSDQLIVNENKTVLLPFLQADYEISTTEKLSFDYHMNSNFAKAKKFANRYQLMSFNTVYRGNANLENELAHELKLRYSRNSFYSGWSYHAALRYAHQLKRIADKITLDNINLIRTSMMSELPQNTYTLNLGVYKTLGAFRLSFDGESSIMDFQQYVNQSILTYKATNYAYTLGVRYDKKEGPEINFDFSQSYNMFTSSQGAHVNVMWLQPSLAASYRLWDNLIVKLNYKLTYYENQTNQQSSIFNLGHASLYYKQNGKSWGVELSVHNVFDLNYRRHYTRSGFLISDYKTYRQPRTILLSVTYKL